MKGTLQSVIILCIIVSISQVVLAMSLGDRLLHRSMRGSDVKELQTSLAQLGYDMRIDGVFGRGTEQAIRDFQHQAGLSVDGIVGDETIVKLEITLRPPLIHVVQRGETLSHIARRYNTSVQQIRQQNTLRSDLIRQGQRLLISEEEPVLTTPTDHLYQVKSGDTIGSIARKFRITSETLVIANNLKYPDRLAIGQQLKVPYQLIQGKQVLTKLIWPVTGRISSPFGPRIHPIYRRRSFHGGIDIAATMHTPVRAAADGIVITAQSMGGYGLGVVIDHGEQVSTLYGHHSRLLVEAGDVVSQGQVIAQVGTTGVSTGPHLDFRIRINNELVDPLIHLPE